MSTAIIFPGQGSQKQGMGRDVAETFDWAMELWETAEKESGLSLREIYWDGEAADMAKTRALQPALTVTNLTLWQVLRESIAKVQRFTPPAAIAGHSLGEYAALAAANVLSPKDTIKAVTLRGKLMSECGAENHAMAAVVKLDMATVEALVEQAAEQTGKVLVVANYNSPAQFVVSGEKEALDALAGSVKEAKGRALPLAVSGAFHSPLIAEAAEEFKKLLGTFTWNTPSIPVYFNATAEPEDDPVMVADIMAGQMTSSVYWVQIMANMYEIGARTFVEVGPGNVLANLAGQNLKGKDDVETAGVGSLEAATATP